MRMRMVVGKITEEWNEMANTHIRPVRKLFAGEGPKFYRRGQNQGSSSINSFKVFNSTYTIVQLESEYFVRNSNSVVCQV